MRVLFLAPANNYHTKKWANYFLSKGHEVHIFSFTNGIIEGATVHIANSKAGTDDSDIKKLLYLLKIKEVRKVIRLVNPDVVSVHYATSYGALAALARIKKYSLSVWGTDIYSFPKKSILHRALLKLSLNKATVLLSTSKAMAEEAKKYTKRDFFITPFGVDLDLFTPIKRKPKKDNTFIFGNIKSLSPEYGIDLIIKAASIIKTERPDIDFKVKIAGNGPCEKEYKALAAEKGVTEIEWLGFIPQQKVAEEWANFDVAVIPSYRESFGVSALEAQASGIPVIITDIDGLKEATYPEKTSIVVRTGDHDQIASALIWLYDNPEKAKKMGSEGREYVSSKYEYNDCFDRIETILKNMCTSHY